MTKRNARLQIPGSNGRRLCGARLRKRRNKHGGRCYCKRAPSIESDRCRFHGGLSTGPITDEGKARAVAAMQAGRMRWIEKMKEEGKKIPCGPKQRSPNK